MRGARSAVLGVAIGVALACGRSGSGDGADAGSAARPRIVRPRPPPAPGEIPADLVASKLSLTIIKDKDTKAPVLATLSLRDGAVSLEGSKARVSIDLDSFDSGIPVRNERVRGIFFETSGVGWESAEIDVPKLPDAAVASLRAKQPVSNLKLEVDLKVHGKWTKLPMVVDADYTDKGALRVKSAEPIEVKISDLGLGLNVRRLSALCMHDSIDDVVKIDAVLEFAAK